MQEPVRLKDSADSTKAELRDRYRRVRSVTEWLCEPLTPEDCVIQSMPDVSPTRWHLAHTTWFFETFVLSPAQADYQPVEPAFEYLFNSYYNSVGQQFPRAQRGMLSRPTLQQVLAYRRQVDQRIDDFFEDVNGDDDRVLLLDVVELGLNHEQQHQELILTDIKHVLSCNPLFPVYRELPAATSQRPIGELGWVDFAEAVRWIGHDGTGFAFDNESPRHRVLVPAFQLATRLVTNGEYLAFMEDGGYERPDLWLSLGWDHVRRLSWNAPLYWIRRGGGWQQFTLGGLRQIDAAEPVCHVSYFEADAYARWAGARLPTEFEWESVAAELPLHGNFMEQAHMHPAPLPKPAGPTPAQLFGDVWQWTSSSYGPYPGYKTAAGALGEYNGKFMCNQYVLRGGSCATPQTHIRPTYRNFFPPESRWQFSGIRLAR